MPSEPPVLLPRGTGLLLPLTVLTFQTLLPLLIRLTRKFKDPYTPDYNPAALTCMAEVFKYLMAVSFMPHPPSAIKSSSSIINLVTRVHKLYDATLELK